MAGLLLCKIIYVRSWYFGRVIEISEEYLELGPFVWNWDCGQVHLYMQSTICVVLVPDSVEKHVINW